MHAIYERLHAWQDTGESARSDAEAAAFETFARPLPDEADFFLHLLELYDTDLYWYTYAANTDPGRLRDLLMDPQMLPGFSDSGAHITNMAFYDVNLRALKVAQAESMDLVAYTVKRLTREPADFFNLDAGRIDVGCQADLVLIDPESLSKHDGEKSVREIYREPFEHQQLVNRSDNVVPMVLIAGETVWQNEIFTDALGKKRLGRALRNRTKPLELRQVLSDAAE